MQIKREVNETTSLASIYLIDFLFFSEIPHKKLLNFSEPSSITACNQTSYS